jgi:AraC family transcriptional regulator
MEDRTHVFLQRDGIDARLTWYPPGMHMARHAHAHHQVSWLLAGELRESHRVHDRDILLPSVGIKPAGFPHANDYGRHGALILSINLEPGMDTLRYGLRFDDWQWAPRMGASPAALALARWVATGKDEGDDPLGDLLALSAPGEKSSQTCVPGWLGRVLERLTEPGDDADLDEVSRDVGVHRVHLSRTFTRCVGLPPSLYRRRCRLARAIGALAHGRNAVTAALDAGFADQAHFTRTVRSEVGISPGRLGKLLRAGTQVTSVQDRGGSTGQDGC